MIIVRESPNKFRMNLKRGIWLRFCTLGFWKVTFQDNIFDLMKNHNLVFLWYMYRPLTTNLVLLLLSCSLIYLQFWFSFLKYETKLFEKFLS